MAGKQRRDHRSVDEVVRTKCVTRGGPESREIDSEIHRTKADRTMEKMRELISDPASDHFTPRILSLLHDYLREIADKAHAQPMKHLPGVTEVMEFLAWKSKEVTDYRMHLRRMLQLCSRPPLLERASECLVSSAVMERYFTSLGYHLAISSCDEEIRRIHAALRCLLIEAAEPANAAAVKLHFRRRAMENSRLPIIVAELLDAALPKIYPRLLELVSLLVYVSRECCYRMLRAGILNTLLVRMDLPYATQLPCTRPPNVPLDGDEYSADTKLLITNILWGLMRSVLPANASAEHLQNLPSPSRCAMWGLRYSFKRQISRGQHSTSDMRMRNDIAALILAGIMTVPSWDLVSTGIAEDIVEFLGAIEPGAIKIWTTDVRFSNRKEDLFFKRTLLMIVAHLAHVDLYIFVMKRAMIMPIILRIVQSCLNTERNQESSSSLLIFESSMHILSLLAPRMAMEFVQCGGARIFLTAIDGVLSSQFDQRLAMIFARAICQIVLQDDASLLEEFGKTTIIPLLMKLIDEISDSVKFTIRRQRVVTLLLLAVEGLATKAASAEHICAARCVGLVTKIFAKCLRRKNEDCRVDERLLLATGSYVWQCVTRCAATLQLFLENGGLYSVLDIIEITSYPVRCLYLAALVDICDRTFCGPCLCTWRGADKRTGLMSLLAAVWREEEDRIGIKRRDDGVIADAELPQMGTKQWTDTYRSKLVEHISPSMIDMIGSERPKIFGIVKLMEAYGDRYEIARKHYKILLDELPTKDRMTLCCVDMYLRLKLGQTWTEIGVYLEQAGIRPLSMDAQLIARMVQQRRTWGKLVVERQRELLAAAKCAQETTERDVLARIRECKLAPALQALDHVRRIRRTTDRSYMLRAKDRQRRQVDAALRFPRHARAEQCHRTFPADANVTAILGQRQSIDSSHLGLPPGTSPASLPFSPTDSSQDEASRSPPRTPGEDSPSGERELADE